MANNGYSIADKRYKAIRKRSFEKILELFLFEPILVKSENALTLEKFKEFKTKISNVKEFQALSDRLTRAWQLTGKDELGENKINIEEIDIKYETWPSKYHELFLEIREEYFNSFLQIEKFRELYGVDDHDRKCKYCGIKESQISKMIDSGKINTKRLLTRGKLMEVDRKNPNGEYSEKNLVLSCYWCNNAKTDEFSYKEFKPIAKGIKKTWTKRLSHIPNN